MAPRFAACPNYNHPGAKRRASIPEDDPAAYYIIGADSASVPVPPAAKRPRIERQNVIFLDNQHHHHHHGLPSAPQLPFVIIREHYHDHRYATPPPAVPTPPPQRSAVPDVGMGGVAMERTASGLSISSDPSQASSSCSPPASRSPHSTSFRTSRPTPEDIDAHDPTLLSDGEAADLVLTHMVAVENENPDSPAERILRALIRPPTRGREWEIDDAALSSMLHAANELFFAGKLRGRVRWDWSGPGSEQYEKRIIGSTALRRRVGKGTVAAAQVHAVYVDRGCCGGAEDAGPVPWGLGRHSPWDEAGHDPSDEGGYETLIVLSQPILRCGNYSRRLLISTFLHELIHCFLFVCCGFAARREGGHTAAFRAIANAIDEWAGRGELHLGDMEADLERFREQYPNVSAVTTTTMVEIRETSQVIIIYENGSSHEPDKRRSVYREQQLERGWGRGFWAPQGAGVWDHGCHDPWDREERELQERSRAGHGGGGPAHLLRPPANSGTWSSGSYVQ